MTTTCNLDSKLVGPFHQTLFLGCSILDFNANLGWGADSSTLSVTLAEDTSSHPQGARLQQQFYNQLQQLSTTNDNLFNSNLFGSGIETNRGAYSEIGKSKTNDPFKNAHINLISNIDQQEKKRVEDNKDKNIEDLGKRYYSPWSKGKNWWLDEDPGFLGSTNNGFSYNQILRQNRKGKPIYDAYELLGVPVLFRYGDNYNFGGIITTWSEDVGSDGKKYKVEIKNFSNVLKNTMLIIGHYSGSIANIVPEAVPNYVGKPLSIPGLIKSSYASPPSQGNLPNVLNIYGFLESAAFGNAKENENGIPANKIYDALNVLIGSSGKGIKNHWNPYGGIVTRSITSHTDPEGLNKTLFFPITSNKTLSSGMGGSLSLEDMGIIPHVAAVDTFQRPIFLLDLSEVPRPPSWLRISSPTISLLDFITQICDGAGFDFFVDFVSTEQRQGTHSGIIKIRTVSRRFQPKQDSIEKFIKELESQDLFISRKNYGKEYNDSISRTMYIGPKQKRLLQCRSHRFTWRQRSFSYDPFARGGAGGFVNVNYSGGYWNSVRKPEPASYRSQNYIKNGIAVYDYQNPNFTELTGEFLESPEISKRINFVNQPQFGEGIKTNIVHPTQQSADFFFNPVRRGNYQDSVHLLSNFPAANSIPIHHDVVCPFFGKHYDGTIRKVYYDSGMGQMQILFRIDDLASSGLDFSPEVGLGVSHFVVYENELRAAGGGFDQWLSYCFDNGFFTDIEKLVYRAIFRRYGGASNVDIGSVHKGFIDSLKSGGFVNNISQINYANASIYGDSLYQELNSIYQIFNKIASTYYGKSYMVSLPGLKTYRDFVTSDIVIGYDLKGQPIYAIEGTAKLYTDFEISAEGAWEEVGNYIDDSMIVGSMQTAPLVNDKNMIQPIVGFNSSVSIDMRLTQFWRAIVNKTLPIDTPAWRSNRYDSYRGGGSSAHDSLLSDVSSTEYVNIPYKRFGQDGLGYSIPNITKTYIKANIENNIEYLLDNDNLYYPKAILNLNNPVYLNSNTTASSNLLSNMLHDSILRYSEAFPVPGKIQRSPLLPPEVNITNGTVVALNYLYQLGRFNLSELLNLMPTQTSIGGLVPKIDIQGHFAGLNVTRTIAQAIASAVDLTYMLSLGPGIAPAFPFSNPGQTASSYNNAQILPKAAIPTFAAVPVQLNQAVYGPWINYPGLIARNIFNDYTKEQAIRRTENLISGTKVEVQESLAPWEFGSMSALDKQVMLQVGDDVNYQQILENGSIDIPIFPDINLGAYLDNNVENLRKRISNSTPEKLRAELQKLGGLLVSQVSANVGAGGVTTTISFRTYTRKLSLFNKENADRLKAISLESIKRNKEIIAKYNELKDRIKNFEVGSSTSVSDAGNLPKMLRWSPMEILVGSNSVTINKNSDIRDLWTDFNYSPDYMSKPYYAGPISSNVQKSLKQTATVTLQDFRETPRELMDNYNQKSIMSLDGLLSPISLYPTPHSSTFHVAKYDRQYCPICRGAGVYAYNIAQDLLLRPLGGAGSANATVKTYNKICDFCEDKSKSTNLPDLSQQPNSPYILTNRSDAQLLEEYKKISINSIAYNTYNPIVLNNGEFSVSGSRQDSDKSAHCIGVVAYGAIAPYRYQDGLKVNYSSYLSNAFEPIDVEYSKEIGRPVANNHRFLGLRGPLMLHSWGYDTDGYPVPNRADQPVMNGRNPKRKKDGTILTIGEDENNPLVFNRENKFYNGWAQLPATWPVGPIDLRWNRNKKMWTIGGQDRFAFVVLEEDLTDLQPVRASLWENAVLNNSSSNNEGKRKLIFVKDNKGITAPRGAKIYCKYSETNGFYEPIYTNTFTASGTITGGSSATIYSAYSDSQYDLSDNPFLIKQYSTTFSNPLEYKPAPGTMGIFVFVNGKWILQSYNNNG
jgi:hypothetical protein